MGGAARSPTVVAVADVAGGFVEEAWEVDLDGDVAAEAGAAHAVFEGREVLI